MKKNYLEQSRLSMLLLVLLTVVISSCEVDDFTEAVPTGDANPAPTLSLLSPGDTARISLQRDQFLDISAEVTDNTPGLSLFSVTILDSLDNEVFTDDLALTGVSSTALVQVPDSIFAIGATYALNVFVEDLQGKRTETSSEFIGIGLLSNQDQVFVIGNFNGWGDSASPVYRDIPMTLVGDYTWEASAWLDEANPEFKFADNNTFGGTEWGESGDGVCDGIADGGSNIACPVASNNVKFIFNDLSLEYSIQELETNVEEVYVLGNFNGWGSNDPDLRMTAIEDHMWQVTAEIAPGTGGFNDGDTPTFKFVDSPDFSNGDLGDWGDSDCDGIANLMNDNSGGDTQCGLEVGSNTFTFNDETLEYSFESND